MIPTKAGQYWVKTGTYEWFNAIAFIGGEAPFLRVNAVVDVCGESKPLHVTEFGPEIQHPGRK